MANQPAHRWRISDGMYDTLVIQYFDSTGNLLGRDETAMTDVDRIVKLILDLDETQPGDEITIPCGRVLVVPPGKGSPWGTP